MLIQKSLQQSSGNPIRAGSLHQYAVCLETGSHRASSSRSTKGIRLPWPGGKLTPFL